VVLGLMPRIHARPDVGKRYDKIRELVSELDALIPALRTQPAGSRTRADIAGTQLTAPRIGEEPADRGPQP
jgi:hypothetical protein